MNLILEFIFIYKQKYFLKKLIHVYMK